MPKQTEWEPKDPEEAMRVLLASADYQPTDFVAAKQHWQIAQDYLLKHADHGLACEGMVTRRRVVEEYMMRWKGYLQLKERYPNGALTQKHIASTLAGVLGFRGDGTVLHRILSHELALLENADREAAVDD